MATVIEDPGQPPEILAELDLVFASGTDLHFEGLFPFTPPGIPLIFSEPDDVFGLDFVALVDTWGPLVSVDYEVTIVPIAASLWLLVSACAMLIMRTRPGHSPRQQ